MWRRHQARRRELLGGGQFLTIAYPEGIPEFVATEPSACLEVPMGNVDARRLPVVAHGAEFLVIGYLMRRNILAYKAPPNNEGYDIICIHPNPRCGTKQIRVQVKSRYQTDCDRAFPVKEKSFDAFDYLVVAFLNIGFFYKKGKPVVEGCREPEFYCFPNAWIREHHRVFESGWQKVHTKGLDLDEFRGTKGFELIAADLGIPYPSRETIVGGEEGDAAP